MSATAPLLRISYPTRRAVLASYRLDGATLSLFVPTAARIEVGSDLRLEVGFGDSPQKFVLKGKVTWRRAEARGMKLEPGLGIAFSGGEKFAPAQLLAFCAGRPLDMGTSQDARVLASIPCRVELGKRTLRARIRDISNSGAFIAARGLAGLPPGRELTLVLEPGWFGLGGKALRAKVVWAGDKAGTAGFGARFLGQPNEVKPLVRKYLGKRVA